MKLFILKILLQRRVRDEGFTLPMVIALGLVMLLLGTVNIVKSNEENLTAINTNSSSDALAIAEIGVARYRELLNQNRILTVYNHDQWATNPNIIGQTCHNMTAAPKDWTGTATKPSDNADDATDKASDDNDNWWNIKEDLNGDGDTSDDGEIIGKYRLVSYEYDRDGQSISEDQDKDGTLDDTTPDDENGVFSVLSDADTSDDKEAGPPPHSITDENDTDDDGESDARGILTVQGQSPDGSEAQVRVEIPLRVNDLNNLKPALWIGKGSIDLAEMGGAGKFELTNDDNIVLSNPGGGCLATAKIDGNNVLNDGRSIPPIIDNPSGVAAVAAIPAIPAIDSKKKNDNFTINRSSTGTNDDLLLPQPNATKDNKGDDGRFLYVVKNDLILDNKNLQTDGAAKVTLYVDNKDIKITGSSSKTLEIGPETRGSSASSHYLEIYVAGDKTITIDPKGGTVDIQAFIHAPNSKLEISGSGTVIIEGAVWVKEINNSGGATIEIEADETTTTTKSEPSYKFYTTTGKRTPRPLTGNPTNWVREEVK